MIGRVEPWRASTDDCEDDAYLDLAGSTTVLTGSGAYFTISSFLRFIRWRTDGGVAGSPVVMIDIVAKE